MSWSNFQYSESTHVDRQPGNFRAVILAAEQGTSKSSGKQMLTISIRPSGTASTVKCYIVDNDYFDANLSEFLDAFPQLKNGFSINNCFSWRGAVGAVKLTVDENGYYKSAKYPWISAKKAENLPPFEWKSRSDEPAEMPVYQGITELPSDADLDIPF